MLSDRVLLFVGDNIFFTIVDIFRAGSDSVATSLAWSIQYLVKYPDLQEQLRQEMDEVSSCLSPFWSSVFWLVSFQ